MHKYLKEAQLHANHDAKQVGIGSNVEISIEGCGVGVGNEAQEQRMNDARLEAADRHKFEMKKKSKQP